MVKKKSIKKRKIPASYSKYLPLVILAILLSGILTLAMTRVNKTTLPQISPNTSNSYSSPSIVPSTTSSKDLRTYTSEKLGITFNYVVENQEIYISEAGNRVYLSTEENDPDPNRFVEVFYKDTSISLEQALKKQFLQSYSSDNCPIIPAQLEKAYLIPGREYLQISTPIVHGRTYAQKKEAEMLCPPVHTYNRRTGLMYFMSDTLYPDKYVFFHLGQDIIAAGELPDANNKKKTWDQTLRFL